MPVYEVFFFPASELMQKNNDALLPVIDHVSRADGVLEVRYGFAEEDKTTLYCVIKWETIDHHKAMMQRADYPDLFVKLKPVMAGTPQLFHIEFENDATSAFDAPTTEITWINLKEGKTKTDVRDVLNKHMGPKIMALPGVVSGSASWNETVEDSNRFLLVIGWESSKVRTICLISTIYC
ncbi:hypothetical protein CPB83DRAFT_774039 [Crepidotus variabilis]|uniref:ABM domain-containing protein n=1 Tax=Crepidotus variabilis TaxID=179855 RepID=A0A9P6JKK5_9AGAR|nr:hypothetical protein CPB83DRAFT_774039 [Crepidotus variabilis]